MKEDVVKQSLLLFNQVIIEQDIPEFTRIVNDQFWSFADILTMDLSKSPTNLIDQIDARQRLILCFYIHLYCSVRGKDLNADPLLLKIRSILGISDEFPLYLGKAVPEAGIKALSNNNTLQKIINPDNALQQFTFQFVNNLQKMGDIFRKQNLRGLDPRTYEHPSDQKALDSLQNVTGLDTIVKKFYQYGIEKLITVQYTGSNIRVDAKNFPYLYKALKSACEIIDYPTLPDLYIMPGFINAHTVGVEKPIVVITQGCAGTLSWDELLFVLGHEIGHLKSQHNLYHTMVQVLPILGNLIGSVTFGIGDVISQGMQIALLSWQRKSEFTADRAGLLCCQNLNSAILAMMKLAGAPIRFYKDLNPKSFLEQAKHFEGLDEDGFNKAAKYLSVMFADHPWTVMRAAEMQRWIEAGEYHNILNHYGKKKDLSLPGRKNKFCVACGAPLVASKSFCMQCGAKCA